MRARKLTTISKVGKWKTWQAHAGLMQYVPNRHVNIIKKVEGEHGQTLYADKYAPQFFNNSLNVLRKILSLAGLTRDENPAYQIERRGIPRKQLNLPTADQFNQLVNVIATSGRH
jgi:hypothetical protein